MLAIPRAYARALRSLVMPGMLRHFAWPVLASLVAWVVIGIWLWGRVSRALTALIQRWPVLQPHLPAGGVGEQGLAATIHFVLYFVSLPLMFATSVLLLEWFAVPMILEKVARAEYPQIERRRGGSQWVSIRRTVVSLLVAIGLIVVTLPLWLIPGFGAVFSVLLSSWLNYRSFSYDVLMDHADPTELQSLPARCRTRLLLLAFGAGMLTLVPIANVLVAPFAALSFAHYLLRELQIGRDTILSWRRSSSGPVFPE
jgi:CysZ protein